jgi:hypothetical protein
VVFVRRQRRLADPFIDLRLFREPAFSASLSSLRVAKAPESFWGMRSSRARSASGRSIGTWVRDA